MSTTLDVPQRLTKLLKIGSSFAARGVCEVAWLQYLSAPTLGLQWAYRKDKSLGEGIKFFSLLGARSVRSQSGNDSRALSTATPFVVRGLIAAAADREEKHLSTRQPLCPPCAKPHFWLFGFLYLSLHCGASVPHTTNPWPRFPLKPCLLQDLSASDTNMRISKP